MAEAEADYRSDDGLVNLIEGLALLDAVIASELAEHQKVARNLASTYALKIYGRIESLIGSDRALPEPDLEHCFKLVLAFDQTGFELPEGARALKIEVVRRLIDRYYEGHPAEQKEKALRQLNKVSGSD